MPLSLPKPRLKQPTQTEPRRISGTFEAPATEAIEAPESLARTRKLPEDPAEFDKAISSCKIMVRPILHGISRLAKTVGTEPLDKEEIDSGTVAFSALMYQAGGMLDARVLVAMWLGGVTIPRVIQFAEAQEEKKKRRELVERGIVPADGTTRTDRIQQLEALLARNGISVPS